MTVERRDKPSQTPFGAWVQEQPELDSVTQCISATDCDMWVHRYTPRCERVRAGDVRQVIDHLMLVEVKCFDADVPFAQRDTLSVVNELCRRACTKEGRRITVKIKEHRPGRVGKSRRVRCLGVHGLQLSGDRPDSSDRIIWDGRYELTVQQLIEVLRFDRDPDHPTRPLDTRRHHRQPSPGGLFEARHD